MLDFGLAKLRDDETAGEDAAGMPATASLTSEGYLALGYHLSGRPEEARVELQRAISLGFKPPAELVGEIMGKGPS